MYALSEPILNKYYTVYLLGIFIFAIKLKVND